MRVLLLKVISEQWILEYVGRGETFGGRSSQRLVARKGFNLLLVYCCHLWLVSNVITSLFLMAFWETGHPGRQQLMISFSWIRLLTLAIASIILFQYCYRFRRKPECGFLGLSQYSMPTLFQGKWGDDNSETKN